MKTPKRYQNKPIPLMPEDNVPDYDRLEIWWQRAKRKNRVRQLKNTIGKMRHENAILKATVMQNRAFLQRLKAICREPNRSVLHRLTDVDMELKIQLMSLKEYN